MICSNLVGVMAVAAEMMIRPLDRLPHTEAAKQPLVGMATVVVGIAALGALALVGNRCGRHSGAGSRGGVDVTQLLAPGG